MGRRCWYSGCFCRSFVTRVDCFIFLNPPKRLDCFLSGVQDCQAAVEEQFPSELVAWTTQEASSAVQAYQQNKKNVSNSGFPGELHGDNSTHLESV